MNHSKSVIERDCTEKCKSAQHGNNLTSVITKRGINDEELCSYLRWKCFSCGYVCDSMGRSPLHLAVSSGRTTTANWLIKSKGAVINAKDLESGYSALHRSIFYGKINAAVALIQLGASTSLLDHDDMTPLDHAMKDRPKFLKCAPIYLSQSYIWGTNINYTLGTGSNHARQLPELHDAFHKKYPNVSVAQICMSKFHSVFVSADGRVFSCGHGQGGRLGLASENTVLIPQELQFKSSQRTQFICVQASVGRDHSLFLSDTGQIWSCGLNRHHVLGQTPPPKQTLVPRALPDVCTPIQGVCVGWLHSVAWGPQALFTWGLNAGQLGHDSLGERPKSIVTPKFVSYFDNISSDIVYVGASDGATVVATKQGDVFALHEYKCRKIVSRLLLIQKIVVIGGHLNAKMSSDILVEKGGNELKVLVLQSTGNIHIWQETYPQVTRCIFNLNRSLLLKDVVLSLTEIFFVTDDGEAFRGEFKTRKKKNIENIAPITSGKPAFHEFLDKSECQMIKLFRYPHIHRAVRITCDLKGRNFAAIQNSPNFLVLNVPVVSGSEMDTDLFNLLNTSDETDAIHDVVFKISGRIFAAHRYIIAQKSSVLNTLIIESHNNGKSIEISDIHSILFHQILLYIYTGTCDVLTSGECSTEIKELINFVEEAPKEDVLNNKMQQKKIINEENNIKDPVRMLQHSAKRFGIKSLHKRLENYCYYNGTILCKSKKEQFEQMKFDMHVFKELQDVSVKAKGGKEISAHKCILAARLEYFNNLLSVRWNETSKRTTIALEIPFNILEAVIQFLYTDEVKQLQDSDNIDFISNLLIVCDELFIDRLKEMCEAALGELITLRNIGHMFQFASMYNAGQLKNCCMEFICLNLSAVLENKSLEPLDCDILNDLTEFYYEWNKILCKRVITPYSDAPSDEAVKTVHENYPVKLEAVEKEKKTSLKINSNRRKGQTRKRYNSFTEFNPFNTSIIEVIVDEKEEIKIEKPIESEKWDKVISESTKKQQRIMQTRLKAIARAKEEIESNNNSALTKLESTPKTVSIPGSSNSSNPSFQDAYSPPTNYEIQIPVEVTPKLSQKRRKKLAAQISLSNIAQTLDNINKKSPMSWNSVVMSKNQNSFSDILNNSPEPSPGNCSPKSPWQKIESPSNVTSPEYEKNFVDIVTDERKLKKKWTKMRDRPLIYTQIEDKAVSDLERFYSIDQVTDEYITIHKVEKGCYAAPLWVHSNAKH